MERGIADQALLADPVQDGPCCAGTVRRIHILRSQVGPTMARSNPSAKTESIATGRLGEAA
eukprot:3824075-Alexandrium_andersonii.AAC.1